MSATIRIGQLHVSVQVAELRAALSQMEPWFVGSTAPAGAESGATVSPVPVPPAHASALAPSAAPQAVSAGIAVAPTASNTLSSLLAASEHAPLGSNASTSHSAAMPFAYSGPSPLNHTASAGNGIGLGEGRLMATLRFLKALDQLSMTGTSGERLAEVLGVNTPKELGPKMSVINSTLIQLGFSPSEAYLVRQSGSEGRIWAMGPKTRDIIDTIEGLRKGA